MRAAVAFRCGIGSVAELAVCIAVVGGERRGRQVQHRREKMPPSFEIGCSIPLLLLPGFTSSFLYSTTGVYVY